MTYRDAKKHFGKKVMHDGEEYILLSVRKRGGGDSPFVLQEFDAALLSQIRNAVRFVPLESVKAVPKETFRRRLQFGESRIGFPDGEQEKLDYVYKGVLK